MLDACDLAQVSGELVVEHRELHHGLVINEGELQLAELNAHPADGAKCCHQEHEHHDAVDHDERLALPCQGLAIEEQRGCHIGELELHERGELDAARRLVAVGRECKEEDEEDEAGGRDEPG